MIPSSISEVILKIAHIPVIDLVFYIPGQRHAQDCIVFRHGMYVGLYSGKTLSQFRDDHPSMIIAKIKDVAEFAEEKSKEPVEEISQQRYMDMLEMLPPLNWKFYPEEDSFKFSERVSGNIVMIFARITIDSSDIEKSRVTRYFELRDNIHMEHHEIIKRCRDFMVK